MIKQETNLRAVVDKNYQEKVKKEAKPRPELVDNFHWAIMRARRSKHLTQKQFADAIGETEVAIKMAEEGTLPENNYMLNKIQSYLKINLLKEEVKVAPEEPLVIKEISFEEKNPKEIKISDLKRLKDTLFSFGRKKERNLPEVGKSEEVKPEDGKKELSDEDIQALIFKK